MGPKSTKFSSMISRVANVMCVTKTRFQVTIYVGPIEDQTYETLHHYKNTAIVANRPRPRARDRAGKIAELFLKWGSSEILKNYLIVI